MKAHYLVKIAKLTEKRCQEVAELISERANAYAPRRQPRYIREDQLGDVPLHESYYVEEDPDGPGYLVKSKVPYWKYVEFGTLQHGSAQPHVRHAIVDAKERYR